MYGQLIYIFLMTICIGNSFEEQEETNITQLQLNSFCNSINGCSNNSLICVLNVCQCAPGYVKDGDQCSFVGCAKDSDCQPLDSKRKCNNGICDQCYDGFRLEPFSNRCITKLGHQCNQSRDCWFNKFNQQLFTNDEYSFPSNMNQSIICRYGRCVCRTDHYPSNDWSGCERHKCSSKMQCNMFGDDPQRYCSKSRRRCLCRSGFIEDFRLSICVPYNPVQFSLMVPFWCTFILFAICLIIHVVRRLASNHQPPHSTRSSTVTGQTTTHNQQSTNDSIERLNLPPPSYETVVKNMNNYQENEIADRISNNRS